MLVLLIIFWLDIKFNNEIVLQFGRAYPVPTNSFTDVVLPIAYKYYYVATASHFWVSGDVAWNHVITVGWDQLTFIRIGNWRIVNNDETTFVALWITIGA